MTREELAPVLLKIAGVLKNRAHAAHLAKQQAMVRRSRSSVALPKHSSKHINEQGTSQMKLEERTWNKRGEVQSAGNLDAFVAAGKKLLKQRASNFGLQVVHMMDDGNCQFRAMSHQLWGTQDHHLFVRHSIVAYLSANRAEFQDFFQDTEEFEEYLYTMSADMTWGDEITLKVAADTFQVRIHVVTTTQENWHLTYEPSKLALGAVFVTYIAPIHYESLERNTANPSLLNKGNLRESIRDLLKRPSRWAI